MVEKQSSPVALGMFLLIMFSAGAWDQQVAIIPGVDFTAGLFAWLFCIVYWIAMTGTWIWCIVIANSKPGAITLDKKAHIIKSVMRTREIGLRRWVSRLTMWFVFLLIALAGHPILAVFTFSYIYFTMAIRLMMVPAMTRRLEGR